MSTSTVSPQNAPRTLEGLMQLQRGVRFRLALQSGMFRNEEEEQAYITTEDESACQALLAALHEFDSNGGNPVQQPSTTIPLYPMGQQPFPGYAPMTRAPQQPPQQQQYQQPPQPHQQPPQQAGFTLPQVTPPPTPSPPRAPYAQPQPQQPQQPQQPPQQPFYPPPTYQPQLSPPQPPPNQAFQQAVRAPQQAQQVVRMPSTTAPAPASNAGAANLQIQTQIAESLKKLAETSQKTQEWLEEQQAWQSRLLSTILAVQLYMAEQTGFDVETVSKCLRMANPDSVAQFIQSLHGQSGK